MRSGIQAVMAAVMVLTSGCYEAQESVMAAADVADATTVGAALVGAAEFVGMLPDRHCGESEQEFLLRWRPELDARLGACARLVESPDQTNRDAVQVAFPGEGCTVGGKRWQGAIEVGFSGGDDRTELSVDLTGLRIEGAPVDAKLVRLGCGDVQAYAARIHTRVPTSDADQPVDVSFDGAVSWVPGLPLIGVDQLVVDGPVTLTYGDRKTGKLVFEGLHWEPGKHIPGKGGVRLVRTNGRTTSITFDGHTHLASVNIDDRITVPVPQP